MQIYTSLSFLFFYILYAFKNDISKRSLKYYSFLSHKFIFPTTYRNHIKDKAILWDKILHRVLMPLIFAVL